MNYRLTIDLDLPEGVDVESFQKRIENVLTLIEDDLRNQGDAQTRTLPAPTVAAREIEDLLREQSFCIKQHRATQTKESQ
jgi:hypothetical protein